jgi:phenylacetate-CoA ligase
MREVHSPVFSGAGLGNNSARWKTVKYYQQDMECASREAMREIQSERLVRAVGRVYANVAYYREMMDRAGLTPADIRSLDDLPKLPFLCKEDLRKAYPYGLLALPRAEAVRIQSTSGTTGTRVVAFYTQKDIDLWDECCARAIVAAGGGRDDVVHVSYGYGLFTGGPGLNGGSHKVGALTLPMSSGNTDRQIQFMCDLGSTILCCTPSYAAFLAETIHNQGMQDRIVLKAGIFGAEAWSEEMRRDIEAKLRIRAYDIYGLTEISGPGVSFECSAQTGMHINEDHFLAEIIDPETGETLPEGAKGELVFTCISKEAFPLLRYRTRDICILSREACSCGRTLVKMTRVMGRTDDMLIIRGVNVFPSQIETVLLRCGFPSNYQIIVDRVRHTDTFEVQVEMSQEMFSDTVRQIAGREGELSGALRTMLGISPKVTVVAPRSIARSEGKAVRVIDRRKV